MNKQVLLLCSQNKLGSSTAEAVLADHPGVEVDSAELNNDAGAEYSKVHVAKGRPLDSLLAGHPAGDPCRGRHATPVAKCGAG